MNYTGFLVLLLLMKVRIFGPMKKITKNRFGLFFTLFILLVFAGCAKDEDSPGPESFYLNASIDGVQQKSTDGLRAYEEKFDEEDGPGRILFLDGFWKLSNEYAGISLMLGDFDGKPGTFTFEPESDEASAFLWLSMDEAKEATDMYVSVSGKMTIESYKNNIIKGSFQFTGLNQNGGKKEVTSGVFNLKVEDK